MSDTRQDHRIGPDHWVPELRLPRWRVARSLAKTADGPMKAPSPINRVRRDKGHALDPDVVPRLETVLDLDLVVDDDGNVSGLYTIEK